MSACGFTTTVTFTGALVKPLAALVAVTEKVSDNGAVSCGTIGAMNVCTEPSGAAGVRMIPAGAVQLNVRAPLAGSTALALSVTAAPLATGLPEAEAVTVGGVFGAGTTIGTSTVAGAEAGVNPSPPTMSWNARFCGAATTGATKLAFALLAFRIVTTGSPGLMICDQVNGPVGGVLAVPSSVTVTPANGGLGADVNTGRATEVKLPGVQVSGGSVSSGNGLSWIEFWLG